MDLSVCVAIPVSDIQSARKSALEAINQKARFIEFRLDYTPNVVQWSQAEINQLIEKIAIPVILTVRRRKEGGQQNIEESRRLQLIEACIKSHPRFVDIEASLDSQILVKMAAIAKENGVGIIYSFHDFKKTPPMAELTKIATELIKKCPGLSQITKESTNKGLSMPNQQPETILKTIFTAQNDSDGETVLKMGVFLKKQRIPFVCFAMGEKGIISRVFSLKIGAYFSFASIGTATAPGQVSISDFYRIYQSE